MSSSSGADPLQRTISATTLPGTQPGEDPAPGGASIAALPESFQEYKQVRLLGAGAMGQVYRAYDTLLDRWVAIKVMSAPSPEHDERMHVEAKAAAAIAHRNVVTVYRVGVLEARPFIVTEYIDGTSLDTMPKPVPWQRALDIGIDLARGLAAAHLGGVLHRDIKPANVIVEKKSGQAKLIDFGLAVRANSDATGAIKLAGTPSYMAPELWQHEPPSQRTDVYAMGVLLYELCTGDLPRPASSTREITRLEDKIPGIDARFAELVHRCLAAEPAERFASGDALRQAIEGLQVTQPVLPAGNPYRGLLPFETAHRELFFGRSAEIQLVIERLRAQHFVLLGGESGVGKSSLARAGVLPLVAEGALADELTWTIHRQVPGRRPLLVLAHALAVTLEMDEDELLADIEQGDVLGVSRRLRRRHGKGRGLLLFFDQLEELVTLADRHEAERTSGLLASLEGTPGIRVLATVRLDYLAALAALPGLGALVERSLSIIRPLKAEAVRQVVVEPARAKGVRFENEELIERLVTAATGTGSALPLLQFALAQLWEQRDVHRGVITAAAFDAIGGVEGALSRHATGVYDALLPDTRQAMRHLLVRLVTSNGTRARQTATELAIHQDDARRKAIAALVEGRLVVADELDGEPVYEIAHEALISGWPKLRAWLDRASNIRAVQERLTAATREWERSGRAEEYLWGPKQLAAGEAIDRADLSAAEAAFLAASARAIRNGRWMRRLAVVAVLALLAAGYGIYHFNAEQHRLNVEQQIDTYLTTAAEAVKDAHGLWDQLKLHHDAMQEQLASDQRREAIAHWQEFLALAPEVEVKYQHATRPLELALSLDPHRARARALMSELLEDRARLAEIMGRTRERDQLLERLSLYDIAAYTRWHRPVQVFVDTDPGTAVIIEHASAGPDGTYATPFEIALQPGSYVLHLQAHDDHAEVRYPLVAHADMLALDVIERPARSKVPEGFVYIPPGRFLVGFGRDADDEPLRKFYNAEPLHERTSGAFLIARHETTYEDWMRFLDACWPDRCDGLVPSLPAAEPSDTGIALKLQPHVEHGWELEIRPTRGHTYRAVRGQPLVYPGRPARSSQRWERFPVSGVSWDDVQIYLTWLDTTGELRGARLCTALEWERAARGADARLFPHGNVLDPDDANFDLTYGQVDHNFGPDEVGAHPRSASPFGVHDMAGNVWEFVDDHGAQDDSKREAEAARVQVRGGSYFHQAEINTVVNEFIIMSDQKVSTVGFRICADAPTP